VVSSHGFCIDRSGVKFRFIIIFVESLHVSPLTDGRIPHEEIP